MTNKMAFDSKSSCFLVEEEKFEWINTIYVPPIGWKQPMVMTTIIWHYTDDTEQFGGVLY